MDKVDREKILAQQIEERGWSDEDTWSLNTKFTEWFLPRLKRFREISIAFPHNITSDEWHSLIDEMIEGFEIFLDDNFVGDQEKVNKINRALEVFKEWFLSLWW